MTTDTDTDTDARKILLLGSTGMIGSRIAAEATDRGHSVTGATRSGGDGRTALDASDADAVAAALDGHDVLITAISPPRDGSEPAPSLLAANRGLIDAARRAGVTRVLVVGGAGSLELPDGTKVVDQDWFPAEVRPEALAQAQLLDLWKSDAGDLDWSYLSPAAIIEPGERTGTFTLGGDELVADPQGQSRISAEDYAVAVVDEIERGDHVRERFTLGYST